MKCETLKELATVQTGPFGSQLHKEDYVDNGYPIVTVEHLGSRKMTRQNLPQVSSDDKKRLEKYTLQEGDIVFSRVGSVDRCSYVGKYESSWLFSGRCLRVRNKSAEISPEYLYYYFCQESIKQHIRNIAVGATMPSINTTLLSSINIFYPTIQIQQKTAKLLSIIDDKIELNNKINDNLEQQVQAIFKSWFVDFEPFGGVMPSDWVVGSVSDFFDISIGKTPPRKENHWFSTNPTDNVWVSISDMGKNGMFISSSSEYLTANAVKKFNVQVVPTNTVILSFKLTVGRVAISNGNITTNEAIAHFKTENSINVEFLYCYLKKFDYQVLGSTSSIATAVNSKTIKNMPYTLPTHDLLTKFHQSTKHFFETIRSNLMEIDKLTQLRDTILPKLMNGEIDVSKVEI